MTHKAVIQPMGALHRSGNQGRSGSIYSHSSGNPAGIRTATSPLSLNYRAHGKSHRLDHMAPHMPDPAACRVRPGTCSWTPCMGSHLVHGPACWIQPTNRLCLTQPDHVPERLSTTAINYWFRLWQTMVYCLICYRFLCLLCQLLS